MSSAFFWFTLDLLSIVVLAFFSMIEMACVSFNKIKLHFYVSNNNPRALTLLNLLRKPSTLFGTTLVGVNVATFFGSECGRRFFQALNLSPDLAPLVQVMLVIIFGEIAPMFAARKYAEHVALSGVPFLYVASRLFTPFLWFVEGLSKSINLIFAYSEPDKQLFLTRDELRKIIEEQEDDKFQQSMQVEYQAASTHIFDLRNKTAHHVMRPLTGDAALSGSLTVDEVQELTTSRRNFWIVFHKTLDHVIGIIYPKDLIKNRGSKYLRDISEPPWFVSASTPLIQILKKFQANREYIAVVINEKGQTVGYVPVNEVLSSIFAKSTPIPYQSGKQLVDRTFPGSFLITELEQELGVKIEAEPEETLSEWLNRQMEHAPEEGETFQYNELTFIIKDTSLLEVQSVQVIAYGTP